MFSSLMLFGASAAAQSSGILLVSDSDVPAGITRSVKRRLGHLGDVTDQKRASSEAGDAAFSKLAKRSGAALVVHLRVVNPRELQAEVRDAASGAVISSHEFPMQGRRLKQPARTLQELVAATRAQLAQEGTNTPPPTTQSDDALDDDEPETSAAAAEPSGPAPAPAPSASEPSAMSAGGEQIMEDPELSARLAARAEAAEEGPRQGLSLQASVGIGPGVHALRVPSPSAAAATGDGEVDTGLAPVAALAVAAQLGLGQWLLRAEAQYRTFFAAAPYESRVMSADGVMQPISSQLTSHSFVIGASPGYRFGGRDSVALMLLLGWTYRSLQPAVETLPGASLRGFVVRPALHIPFGEVFCLRLAPELIVVQSSETNAQGFMAVQSSGGLGWGVEAAVDVRLAKLLGAGLQYRRSRISATRSSGEPAIDEEWYVAAQAVLSL